MDVNKLGVQLQLEGLDTTSAIIAYLRTNKIELSLNDTFGLLNRSSNGFYWYSDDFSKFLTALVSTKTEKGAIVINAGIGEIQSQFGYGVRHVGLFNDKDKFDLAAYLYPDLDIQFQQKIKIERNDCDTVIAFMPQLNIKTESREILGFLRQVLDTSPHSQRYFFFCHDSILDNERNKAVRAEIISKLNIEEIYSFDKKAITEFKQGYSLVVCTRQSVSHKVYFYKITDFEQVRLSINSQKQDFEKLAQELGQRWDYFFHAPENRTFETELQTVPFEPIKNLVDEIIARKNTVKQSPVGSASSIRVLTFQNIAVSNIVQKEDDKFVDEKALDTRERKCVLQSGDVIFSFITKKFKPFEYIGSNNLWIINRHMGILRGKKAGYIALYLQVFNGEIIEEQVNLHSRGNTLKQLSIKDFENIKVPIFTNLNPELLSKKELLKNGSEAVKLLDTKDNNFAQLIEDPKFAAFFQNVIDQALENNVTLKETNRLTKETNSVVKDFASKFDLFLNDFKRIKESRNDLEVKIHRLERELDETLKSITPTTLATYEAEIKLWFEKFEKLEKVGQKYLPQAEFIYEKLQSLDLENMDYSPFIIQYCRTIENELLQKFYRKYLRSLKERGINFAAIFSADLTSNKEEILKIATRIEADLSKKEEDCFLELGRFPYWFEKLRTKKFLSKSPLFQDINNFLMENFEEMLFTQRLRENFKKLAADYRNKSAHPDYLSIETAEEFREFVQKLLKELVTFYKE